MKTFDESNLPDDARGPDFLDAHGPHRRFARVHEVNEAFTLVDPKSGTRFEVPSGGFLVWENGVWSAVDRDEFFDARWEITLGEWGTSIIEEIAEEHE